MIRKILFVVLWFPFTIAILITNLSMLNRYAVSQNETKLNANAPFEKSFRLTAAAAGTSQIINATIIPADARILLLRSFMSRHNSPMTPYADIVVSEADRYGIDFRLVPAIAMCESNLGKRIPSKDSYNAWGVAVYTGATSGKVFDNWVDAIQWVTKYIKEKYYDLGLIDLHDIGAKWAPPSVENGYSWTNCVDSFVNDII
jgi:hypothetical protein